MRAQRPARYRVRKYSASVMVVDSERGVRSVSPPANLSIAKHNNIWHLHATNLKWLVDKHGPTSDALRGLREFILFNRKSWPFCLKD